MPNTMIALDSKCMYVLTNTYKTKAMSGNSFLEVKENLFVFKRTVRKI